MDAPELNHGFSVDARTNGDGLFLASSEAENPAQRPSLNVTYVPAVDSGSGLLAEFFVGTHHEEKVLRFGEPEGSRKLQGVTFEGASEASPPPKLSSTVG